MRPARFDVTTVDIRCGKYQFRATGTVPTFAGFLKAYEEPVDEDAEGKDDEKSLPELRKDEKLALEKLEPRQHFTQPPPRYTEASLVKELEVRQIGRPSTYAQIISTLRMRKYAAMKAGRFTPTDLGMAVNRILVMAFPDLFDVAFTAKMEDALDRIETGELDWTGTLVDFYQPFNERLQSVNAQRSELKSTLTEETDEKCEKCGKPMVIRWGRNGRFMACVGFPGMPEHPADERRRERRPELRRSMREVRRENGREDRPVRPVPGMQRISPLPGDAAGQPRGRLS